LSQLEQLHNAIPEPAEVEPVEAVVAAAEDTKDETVRKRKRGRPATKDKSVGTGPSQPPVNKAVQVLYYKIIFFLKVIVGKT
jgi:hypothetical protein